MGMISILLSSPFCKVLAYENESVCNTTLSDKKSEHRGPGASMLTDEFIETLSLSDEQVEKWKEVEANFRKKWMLCVRIEIVMNVRIRNR